jgi:hypothetical protein
VLLQCPQATFVARYHEFMHESGGRGEGEALVFLVGGQPQCQGDMGFAGARWPERVVRHGSGPERVIQTGIGPVEVRRVKLRDRGAGEGAERIRFTSAILPRWGRRTRSLDALLPILYLRGVSMGDFQEALGALDEQLDAEMRREPRTVLQWRRQKCEANTRKFVDGLSQFGGRVRHGLSSFC